MVISGTAMSQLATWAAMIAIPVTRALGAFPALREKMIVELDRRINWRAPKVIATSRDKNRFHCNLSDEIQRSIAYRGDWDPGIGAYIRRALRPGDTFIDCGANIGYFSLLAARCVGPSGKVVAIEASPAICELLRGNIELNDVRNVRAVQIAASDRPGRIKLYAGPTGNSGQTTTEEARGLPLIAEIDAAPLLDIVTPDELKTARLIKIDIEGAELPVLLHLLTERHRLPSQFEIIVEITPQSIAAVGSTADTVLGDFERAGYHPYLVQHGNPKAERITGSVNSRKVFDVVLSKTDAEAI
jgi:FkbM family methyltransferase